MSASVEPERVDPEPASKPRDATSIGPYRLVRPLGEGGMGEVWLATQQEPVRRSVALKLIKHGLDSKQVVARFTAERQALALMDHASIAKIFDAGTTADGRLYFAMELVDGLPITQYCDRRELPTAERLALFQHVCLAVHHAHQKGVVHRDLKPSNVLVADDAGKPRPIVIDFGIAKALEHAPDADARLTETMQILGTPEYMAPEQATSAAKDVDTRADIYSLGVMLYELLTGTRPFDASLARDLGIHEFLRLVREVDPPKPSTRLSSLDHAIDDIARKRHVTPRALRSALRGDLDWIVMKAIEKDRARRYSAASALAEDVARFLAHQPVLAGPPSASYRLRKYVRRHAVGVGATAAVFFALIAGVIASWRGYVAASEQRTLAEQREQAAVREAGKAKRVAEILQRMLRAADPNQSKGADYPVRELLGDFERELGGEVGLEPEVEAFVRRTIGNAFANLGLGDRARPHLERALELRESSLGPNAAETIESAGDLVFARFQAGDAEGAADEQLAVIARARALVGERGAAVAKERETRAMMLEAAGKLDEATRELHAAIDVRAEVAKRDPSAQARKELARTRGWLGQVLDSQGEFATAESLLRESIAELREVAGADRWQLGELLTYFGRTLRERNRLPESEAALREALAIDVEIYGERSAMVAIDLDELGMTLQKLGKVDEGLELSRQARETLRTLLGDRHPDFVTISGNYGVALMNLGRLDLAIEVLRETLGAAREVSDPVALTHQLTNLGVALQRRGSLDDAQAMLREALDVCASALGADHVTSVAPRAHLGGVLIERADFAGAKVELAAAIAIGERVYGADHPEVLKYVRRLSECCAALGERDQAVALRERVLAGHRLHYPSGDARLARSIEELATILPADATRRAEQLWREALALRLAEGPDAPRRVRSLAALARIAIARSDHGEAERLLQSAQEHDLAAPESAELRKDALRAWIELCQATERPEEAAAWRAKLDALEAATSEPAAR